jgi:hypothetical protein
MSISISLSDVRTFPEMAKYSELELIEIKMDRFVLPYLDFLGLDMYKGFEYVANKHRNLNDEVIIGFRAIGTMRNDREFRRSKLCTPNESVQIVAGKDLSLAQDLELLTTKHKNISDIVYHEDNGSDSKVLVDYVIENDYLVMSELLDLMNEEVFKKRGTSWNESGELKTYEEYALFAAGLAPKKKVNKWRLTRKANKEKNV